PHVNDKLRALGIRFRSDPGEDVTRLGPGDVVILPAFGVTIAMLEQLQSQGCTLVDTTCGSVLNVWKNVRRYAQDGFTSVIHGKVHHEETRATASQALQFPHGRYLVVLDRGEAQEVCDYVRGKGSREAFVAKFSHAASDGFDPDTDLGRIGLANQTTMLMSESVAIADMLRDAMADRFGERELPSRFRAFETICSATQDRQDAVLALLDQQQLDLMIVIGGYNSSNTCNLARIFAERLPPFHIAGTSALVSTDEVRHRPVGGPEKVSTGWLPAAGSVTVGITAGASTPDVIVGQVIERLAGLGAAVQVPPTDPHTEAQG
ncbi:MAG: 4-hydroxy-3-methylbut-2-enyl diphosphate reductase, partial [Acidobacteria bacterium]